MANRDTQGGLRFLKHKFGLPCVPNAYRVKSDYATALFIGDPVVLTGAGGTDPISQSGGMRDVQKATVSTTITGVIVSIDPVASVSSPNIPTKTYIPASTGGIVYVIDDPDALFLIQEDSVGGNIASATAEGEFCDLVFNSGDTATGLSKVELDSSDAGTGDNVRIEYLYDAPDNVEGANADWVVSINEHTYRAVSTPI